MKFEVIYAHTSEELEEKVAALVNKGWVVQGEPDIAHSNLKPGEVDFIYHYQVITQEGEPEFDPLDRSPGNLKDFEDRVFGRK